MSSNFSRLLRQTGVYALGNALVKAGGLFLAPLYLNVSLLSQAGYGYLVLLEVTGQLAVLVAGLGVASGLLKFYADPSRADDRPALPMTALLATAIPALLMLALFVGASELLAGLVMGRGAPEAAMQWLGVFVFFKTLGTIPFTLLRTEERAGLYVVALTAEMVLLVAGVYVALVSLDAGLTGVVAAQSLAAAGSTLLLTGGMMWHRPLKVAPRLVRPLIAFGAPLVLAGLASRVLNLGDRYVLNALTSAETVALYGWAAKLAGLLNMLLVQSFQLSISVVGLKSVSQGDTSLQRRAFRHFVLWAGWAVLGLSLVTYDATRLLVVWTGADAAYLAADPYVLPLALGFMAFGVNVVVNNVLYATARTRAIGLNLAAAAVLNIALNVALIPWIGAMGAAVATTIAYTVLAVVASALAERQVHVGYPWRVFAVSVGLVVALYLVGVPSLHWDPWARVLIRGALIIAYWPLVLVLRLYRLEEVRAGLSSVRRWWAARREA